MKAFVRENNDPSGKVESQSEIIGEKFQNGIS